MIKYRSSSFPRTSFLAYYRVRARELSITTSIARRFVVAAHLSPKTLCSYVSQMRGTLLAFNGSHVQNGSMNSMNWIDLYHTSCTRGTMSNQPFSEATTGPEEKIETI